MIGKTDIDATKGGVANTGTVGGDVITGITFEQHRAALKEDLADLRKTLETAHASERDLLSKEITELERKLTNIEQDYELTLTELANLKEQLKRFSNTAPTDQLAAAMAALDNGDRTKADKLLQQIEQSNIESAAHAVYLRGDIAAAEIRWADAATLYAKSAHLDPTFYHLFAAREFHWRAGEHTAALALGDPLIAAAINEFGEDSTNHAVALNEHALTLEAMGDYPSAEPLYKQAIAIGKATIGVEHPSYAIRLNNLANLYSAMGDYPSAEPLYKQAIAIDKATIGEDHPDYAIDLNNLATLYRDMGDYPSAEPLYLQAIEIGKATIGEDHPSYAIRLNNLANLYLAMDNYTSAEALYKQAIAINKATIGVEHPS